AEEPCLCAPSARLIFSSPSSPQNQTIESRSPNNCNTVIHLQRVAWLASSGAPGRQSKPALPPNTTAPLRRSFSSREHEDVRPPPNLSPTPPSPTRHPSWPASAVSNCSPISSGRLKAVTSV